MIIYLDATEPERKERLQALFPDIEMDFSKRADGRLIMVYVDDPDDEKLVMESPFCKIDYVDTTEKIIEASIYDEDERIADVEMDYYKDMETESATFYRCVFCGRWVSLVPWIGSRGQVSYPDETDEIAQHDEGCPIRITITGEYQ